MLKIGGKDTITFALFLSVFISSYKAVLCTLRRIPLFNHKNNALTPFLAGCVAGLSLYLDANHSRRVMIALYLSTRTLHFIGRWIWQRKVELFLTGRSSNKLQLEDVQAEVDGSISFTTQPLNSIGTSAGGPVGSGSLSRVLGDSQSRPRSRNGSSKSGTPDAPVPVPTLRIQRASVSSSPPASDSEDASKDLDELKAEQELVSNLRKNVRYSMGTIIMMLSSSQILMAYVLEPHSVASSYQSFLLTHGGIRDQQPKRARDYLETMAHVIRAGMLGFSTKYLSSKSDGVGLPPSFESNFPAGIDVSRFEPYMDHINQAPHEYVMCSLQHPAHSSCELGAWHSFKKEWWRAMQLYIPLNAIMTVIFKGSSLMKKPTHNLRQYVVGTARSTLFLTAYCTMAWYYVNGLLCGATVLIEAPSRRLELGLYCLPRAAESLWNCGVKWGWWKHIPGGEGIYFSLMTGVLMALYQTDPASIHDGYRKVMFRFFGIN
ncbi:hypothetical protein HDU83_006380 [Entophlyctis luteolus]|nr:hypothetical protein HDU82_000631 [Entophlyctis luteolus]KAJ3341977.1 hypothetical protein HDU83_006380 [Entophlyctis luteolus]